VPFFVAATVALVNGLIAIRRLPETRRPGVSTVNRSTRRPNRNTRIWVFAVAGFTAICAFSGFEATFSLFADRRFGLSEGPVALIFLGVGLLLVFVQTRLIEPVVERLGSLGALQAGLVLNAAGLGLLAVTWSWLLLVPALALLTAGQGLAIPNLTAAVADRAPSEHRGEALGFQQRWQACGRIVGPVAAGALFQHVGVPAPYVAGGALALAALGMLVRAQDATLGVPSTT
jgi:predicted MFS family arabinose efflux permease